jgi:hypothetical protein
MRATSWTVGACATIFVAVCALVTACAAHHRCRQRELIDIPRRQVVRRTAAAAVTV